MQLEPMRGKPSPRMMTKVEDDQTAAAAAPPGRPRLRGPTDTFWASCSNCKMEFEYFKTYINHTLICFHCRQAFIAVEIQSVSGAGTGRLKKSKRIDVDDKSDHDSASNVRDLSEIESRNMLIQIAVKEIMLNKMRERESGWPDLSNAAFALMALRHRRIRRRFSPVTTTMTVTEPDFHDFDRRRTEKCLCKNQVWAAYGNGDGMPRCYAYVHQVKSFEPFRIRISWLNINGYCKISDMESMKWVCAGFMKTGGDFRGGKIVNYDSAISFSHRVKWTEGEGGAIRIYPRKGEVWAVYRHWSADWNELTPYEVIHKYDIVEVVSEDYGAAVVAVLPLVKVSGFKAVFHRHLNPAAAVRIIPREELFQFSHQVPAVLLTGREDEIALRGCWELDPAATPLELLEVITVSEEREEDGMKKTAEVVSSREV